MPDNSSWTMGAEPSRVKARGMLLVLEEAALVLKGFGKTYDPEEYRLARQRYNDAKQKVFDLMVKGMEPEQLELPFLEK